ncbi:type II toxin-antitoxin system VapC family toxin [Candidatus Tisiphia endosymbiont of Melanophora roralis]|uniref:type II toxin-antitoxin system VapC family toxin n=1 Tax=Candidatus Tisiphia endosymbiont of Melanophora roralis TaxID=3066261 RepID=UPI001E6DAE6C|nr:MAG: type II toxin-antitoxin system VapC family toxin [Rickettsia endosymbiont of Cimex lectularius]
MSYLIDTNVISELIKVKQNTRVVEWFNAVQNRDLYLSVLTIGEIRKGIDKITDIKRRENICIWLDQELTSWFAGRILPIDQQVANKWGVIQAQSGRTLPAVDSLIAATALHFDLILVTRNIKDFSYLGLEIINPF